MSDLLLNQFHNHNHPETKFRQQVIEQEKKNLEAGLDDYTEKEVRQAIVFTRQELIAIYWKLEMYFVYFRWNNLFLFLIVVLLSILVFKLW